MPDSQPTPDTTAPRLLGFLFGFIFAGIGLTVIFFLWTAGDGFGAPPLFFRIFGSFIALGFIGMGCMMFFGALNADKLKPTTPPSPSPGAASSSRDDAPAPASGYVCPSCGARLGEAADVSPKGDVKCGYCRKWFNIHG